MGDSKTEEKSFKEKRIRDVTLVYYSRPDIRKALFEFSKNRECIPRYFEGFGKRPDSFQYEQDILEQVKKGATSFHCSEELWSDPLEISTDFSQEQLKELRTGWDLLLDIDSPYLEYSKIYAELLIKSLKSHGVNKIGVKFSGSKGFHIIVPWKSFPEEIYNQKTRDMFPEWPRVICSYLSSTIQPKLAEKLFENDSMKDIAKKTGKNEDELVITECLSCNRPSGVKYLVTWTCSNCSRLGEVIRLEKNSRIPKCPECRRPLIEKSRKEILFCEYCDLRSDKNPEMFAKSREKTESLIDADLVLVSSRHLFRMPYSLHEKTSLVSVVLNPEDVKKFQMKDANPFKVEIKNFYPDSGLGEAKTLLLQALDWQEQKDNQENITEKRKTEIPRPDKKISPADYKKIVLSNPDENLFPPQIRLLLKGVKQDGRKRALFILLSFFKSLGIEDAEIEKRVTEWNNKNYTPLKKGYVQSQLNWYKRNPARLPPNFNNPLYKDLGVDQPDELSKQLKNPVSYTIRKYFNNINRNKV